MLIYSRIIRKKISRGNFKRQRNCLGGNFPGGGVFYLGGTFYGGVLIGFAYHTDATSIYRQHATDKRRTGLETFLPAWWRTAGAIDVAIRHRCLFGLMFLSDSLISVQFGCWSWRANSVVLSDGISSAYGPLLYSLGTLDINILYLIIFIFVNWVLRVQTCCPVEIYFLLYILDLLGNTSAPFTAGNLHQYHFFNKRSSDFVCYLKTLVFETGSAPLIFPKRNAGVFIWVRLRPS